VDAGRVIAGLTAGGGVPDHARYTGGPGGPSKHAALPRVSSRRTG